MPELAERRAMQKKLQPLLQRQVEEVIFPIRYGEKLIIPKSPPFSISKEHFLVAIDGRGARMCLQFQCSELENKGK